MLAAAGAGGLATVGLLAAFGAFDRAAPTSRVERVRVEDQAVAQLAANIAPSIVTVSVVSPTGARSGSGVCVRHSGDILTNDRLLRDAVRVSVTTHDGVTQSARVMGHDPDTDLALLHVPSSVQAAPIAETAVNTGDSVLAVGSAGVASRDPWIGDGIVASIDGVVSQFGGPSMDGLIATSASPGKTGMGGALLDRKGSVAGIVVGPANDDSTTYAVPMTIAKSVYEQLAERGFASHGWLGVVLTDSGADTVVTSTVAKSPAQRAGIQPRDVVVAVDGRAVASAAAANAAIRWYPPESHVVVKLRRGAMLRNVPVVVGGTSSSIAKST